MNTYSLTLAPASDADAFWEQLSLDGWTPLYSVEEDGHSIIVAQAEVEPESIPGIIKIEKIELPEINWEQQWELHGANYHDGYVHVERPPLKLKPGPGFGDLSHPTTALMLELLPHYVKDQIVVDIGSGSGILTLASDVLGAKKAIGVDIDPLAVEHAKENTILNGSKAIFFLPEAFSIPEGPLVTLMNMVSSEQEIAWQSYPLVWKASTLLLTSGVLTEDKDAYLEQMQLKGWHSIHDVSLDGWHAFVFSKVK